jgi:hypothetical protein
LGIKEGGEQGNRHRL